MISAWFTRFAKFFAPVAALACIVGCAVQVAEEGNSAVRQALVPSKGAANTLDIGSWNLEWFGDSNNGPDDNDLQRQNAYEVIGGADMDIWGVAEIVDADQFNQLKAQLPGYAGFLANESSVIDGPAYYSGFSNAEQKVGLLYKSSLATVLEARIILTANDYDFAGRPPLQVKLRVSLNGTTEDIVVIVMHAKCCSDSTSWQRRQNASNALKSYLDSTFPTQKVWVIGDFNDDLDTSIAAGSPSPYLNFLNDSARYRFPSKALTDAGIASTTGYPDTIDHHLNTNESNAQYIVGSVEAYRVDQFIADYANTTSDHFPILSRYTWPRTGGTPAVTVTAPNGGESWAAGSLQNITWTSNGVANVRLEYSLNSGSSWSTISTSTSASAGTYAWTVPSNASTAALVRVSDVVSSATDTSNGTFVITAGGPAQLIINEICANEPGSDTAGEFVEVLNIGGTTANIGGYTLSDGTSTRHTFAANTLLNPGKAIVVFAGATAIPSGLNNAIAASTGALSLANGGDTVSLRTASGATVQTFTYSSSLANTDGVSMNRSPDGSAAGAFVKHTTLSSLPSSAGVRVSGGAW